MTISVCPIAVVQAPAERVWSLLSEPASYATWWDAATRSIVPAGPAQSGQTIYAEAAALGRRWPVNISVESVDSARRQIDLTTRLPLGITVHNHIICTPIDGPSCRVTFG